MVLRTKTVTWGDLSVTVREPSAIDVFEEPHTWRKVIEATWGKKTESENINLLQDSFVVAITRTQDTSFEWPNGDAKAKDYKAAFEFYKSLPGGFVRAWIEARRELERPPVGDPDLAPPQDLDIDQKKVNE